MSFSRADCRKRTRCYHCLPSPETGEECGIQAKAGPSIVKSHFSRLWHRVADAINSKGISAMRISIIGLGKLGSPMAAAIASKGHNVVGVNINASYVAAVVDGRPPVNEPGLAQLIKTNASRLTATGDTVSAVCATDITFVIVPTPSQGDGGFSLKYVLSALQDVGAALKRKSEFHVVVLSSTVMPGSTGGPIMEALERVSGKVCGIDFGLWYRS